LRCCRQRPDIDSERMRIEQGKGRKDRMRCSRQSIGAAARLVSHRPTVAVVPRIANTGIDAGYNLKIMYTDGSRETIPLRWGVRAFQRHAHELGSLIHGDHVWALRDDRDCRITIAR